MSHSAKIRSIFGTAFATVCLTAVAFVPIVISTQQSPGLAAPTEAKPTQKIAQAQSPTLKNLQAAYNGESNANVRYLAFAKKAQEEGYGQVASLFRATARAEQIHRDNHAVVIRQMGATPQNKIETPLVKSTKENLQEAIKGESYERDTMYPQFIAQAQKEGKKPAVRTFEFAVEAEKGHAKFYSAASNNLAAWKGGSKTFYVCPECGLTVALIDFEKCPECGEPKGKFEKIT
ncbi:rubrerythrin family protein [Microcoleus sp. A003_D6]|uniref:rubrerythrin family protein n=1 Tax=Microcoleus sp. A003_D6 TaxID=3055266 RepID=UPI002FD75DC8